MKKRIYTPLRLVEWAAKSEAEAKAELRLKLPKEMQSLVDDPKVKFIPLTQNKFAAVDIEDFDRLYKKNWYCLKGYACRISWNKGKRKIILMHRVILNTPKHLETDHINSNRLDNRKANLRSCTTSQNGMNRKKHKNNTSGYKGVFWVPRSKKFVAQIRLNRKPYYLGGFDTAKEASQAYVLASKKLHGEFSHL